MIERKGANTGLVTTRGFRDVARDAQREMRYDIYDLHSPPVPALVPRAWRFEVKERLNGLARCSRRSTTASLEDALRRPKRHGVEAVAVCFLHSFKNPAHERRPAGGSPQALPT